MTMQSDGRELAGRTKQGWQLGRLGDARVVWTLRIYVLGQPRLEELVSLCFLPSRLDPIDSYDRVTAHRAGRMEMMKTLRVGGTGGLLLF